MKTYIGKYTETATTDFIEVKDNYGDQLAVYWAMPDESTIKLCKRAQQAFKSDFSDNLAIKF